MSIQWPELQLQPQVLAALPPHHRASPTLKRACKRYIIAMNELNKQVCDYNTEGLEEQMTQCRTHAEVRQLLLKTACVPFVSVSVQTLLTQLPRLVILDRAAQCVNLLREVLDEWETGGGDRSSGAQPGESSQVAPNFSIFTVPLDAQWPSSLV